MSETNHSKQDKKSTDAHESPSSSTNSSPCKNYTDNLFEPSIDMMVNDFDDERTLAEEEALAAIESEDPDAELLTLQMESDMPIEELLARYYSAPHVVSTLPTPKKQLKKSKPEKSSVNNSKTEKLEDVPDAIQKNITDKHEVDQKLDKEEKEEDEEDDKEPSQLRILYPETYKHDQDDQRSLRTISRALSDDEDDGEYCPDDDDSKKTIMVGSEFQAVIPEGLRRYDDALPYENDDKLVWDPSKLKESDTENYLLKAYAAISSNTNKTLSTGCSSLNLINNITNSTSSKHDQDNSLLPHLRDDEQALYLLLQCGQNIEEALRRRRLNIASIALNDNMSLWSETECQNFEKGLRVYGKDFYSIQRSKVRTRSVGELVQFYYLWKKTERHDVFANKTRLEKKKYSLLPGVTDCMDRFLEENESGGSNNSISSYGNVSTSICNVSENGHISSNINTTENKNRKTVYRDRSSSPGVNSLLYADSKHHRNQHRRSKNQLHVNNKNSSISSSTGMDNLSTCASLSAIHSSEHSNQSENA